MIEKVIRHLESYYAHVPRENENKKEETLEEHIALVMHYFNYFLNTGLKAALEELLQGAVFIRRKKRHMIADNSLPFFTDAVENTIRFHDLGKINPVFQWEKMGNSLFKEKAEAMKRTLNSSHSLSSSVLFLFYYLPKVDEYFKDKDDKSIAYRILHDLSFVISKHHSPLKRLDYDFFDTVIHTHELMKNNSLLMENIVDKERFQSFDFTVFSRKIDTCLEWKTNENYDYFLFVKLAYGLLVTSDYYAAYTYSSLPENERVTIEQLGPQQIVKMAEQYKNSDLFKQITMGKESVVSKDSDMNAVRTSLFWNVHRNYEESKSALLYFLEAPTGSGKTNVSYSLGLRMLHELNKKRLFYIFPFNTLMDQTKSSLEGHLTDTGVRLQILNSTVSTFNDKEEFREEELDYRNYQKELFKKQMIHFPFILTSHVHFFEMLFGTSRESHLKIPHLMDSVIIMDEIQSYSPKVWKSFIAFLLRYAQVFRWKVIIMSATLPPLEQLLGQYDDTEVINLLPNAHSYYQHPCFKDRVRIVKDYLTQKPLTKDQLFDSLTEIIGKHTGKSILVEMITRTAAQDVFNFLKERFTDEFEILKLDGDDTRYYRERLLQYIKNNNHMPIILVSTQVIEAGVDIDMEVGIKNISLLDGEEQFAGRINRSFQMDEPGMIYFIHYTEPRNIYRDDPRLVLTLANHPEKGIHYFREKKYREYYEEILPKINQFNHFEEELYKSINELNYFEVKKAMNLINQSTVQVFINFENNGEYGSKVWQEYLHVLNLNWKYAEKMMKLERLKEKMSPYLFNFNNYKRNLPASKVLQEGGIYYIENGEEYMSYVSQIGAKTLDKEKFFNWV